MHACNIIIIVAVAIGGQVNMNFEFEKGSRDHNEK